MHQNNIAIVWDFDGTLTPGDSTTKTVEFFLGKGAHNAFWDRIQKLKGTKQTGQNWEHVLAMDAPIWMYSLSELARAEGVPLNTEFFQKNILKTIELYSGVSIFLQSIKDLEKDDRFLRQHIHIHHFIVSAGLKELIELTLPKELVRWTFGCRYVAVVEEGAKDSHPISIPAYCVDETAKTRSIFEIAKGVFENPDISVNRRVEKKDMWCPFSNMIYVGDGPTDVPSLSLVRDKGGMGIAVYDPEMSEEKMKTRFHEMRLDKRTDLITPANFDVKGELYKFIASRCWQICQRYEAENAV